jgi:antitoxin VapB
VRRADHLGRGFLTERGDHGFRFLVCVRLALFDERNKSRLVISLREDIIVFMSTQELGMPLNIRSEIVNQLAERLAARRHVSKTDAVRIALQNELRRLEEAVPLRDRVRLLQDRVLSRPATGMEADKAFYDELSGNP